MKGWTSSPGFFSQIWDNKSENVNQSQETLKSSGKYYKYYGAPIGLVVGLVAAYYLGAATLVGVSAVVCVIAFTIVGTLFGVGVGYGVGKCLDNIDVKNVQQEEVVKG